MSFRDAMDQIASADEFPSRDEREASLFDEYDDPSEIPASVIYAPRTVGLVGSNALANRLGALAQTMNYGDELPVSSNTNDDLSVALRASLKMVELEQRIERLEQQCKRIADYVQGLPNREDYDALVGDVHTMQEQIRGLSLRKAS